MGLKPRAAKPPVVAPPISVSEELEIAADLAALFGELPPLELVAEDEPVEVETVANADGLGPTPLSGLSTEDNNFLLDVRNLMSSRFPKAKVTLLHGMIHYNLGGHAALLAAKNGKLVALLFRAEAIADKLSVDDMGIGTLPLVDESSLSQLKECLDAKFS